MYLLVGKTVEVEVAAVVDGKEDVTNGVDNTEFWSLSPILYIIVLEPEACHHVEDSLGCCQDCEAYQGGDQQNTRKILLTLISYPPKWVKNKYISKCLKCSETNNALKKKLSPGHFCPGDN